MDELNLGLLIIRVIVGVTFAAHGWAKVKGGLAGVAGWFEAEGLKPGALHARLAAFGEIGTGLAFAAGLLFPFTNAGIVGIMVVAGFIGHRKNGFFIIREGWEYVFILATIAAGLASTGPGEWSIDNAIDLAIDGWAGLAIAVVGGVGAAVATLAVFFKDPARAA